MSEANSASRVAPPPPIASTLSGDAPIPTAPALDPGEVASLMSHPATAAVVQGVYGDPNVHPANAASVAASVLQALMPLVQPTLQVTRASARTSSEVAIGFAALSALLAVFFPHPNG